MSLRWNEEDLIAYQERQSSNRKKPKGYAELSHHADEGSEAKLQAKIKGYCQREGWYYFEDRSRGCNRPGHPDLVIALKGRTLWLELKSRHGRLRPEQAKVIQQLLYLGHEVHLVKSFKQFMAIVKGNQMATESVSGYLDTKVSQDPGNHPKTH